jgi:hypothetical protein
LKGEVRPLLRVEAMPVETGGDRRQTAQRYAPQHYAGQHYAGQHYASLHNLAQEGLLDTLRIVERETPREESPREFILCRHVPEPGGCVMPCRVLPGDWGTEAGGGVSANQHGSVTAAL